MRRSWSMMATRKGSSVAWVVSASAMFTGAAFDDDRGATVYVRPATHATAERLASDDRKAVTSQREYGRQQGRSRRSSGRGQPALPDATATMSAHIPVAPPTGMRRAGVV